MLSYTSKISDETVDVVNEAPINPWRDCLPVPVLGPQGQISVTFFDRRQIERGQPIKLGDLPVSYTPELGAAVSRWWAARGWVLYESVCNGAAKGIDASPAHWDLWAKIAKLFASGRAPRRGAIEQVAKRLGLASHYHPEVARRRGLNNVGGAFSMDADGLMELFGFAGDASAGVTDDAELEALLAEDTPEPVTGGRKGGGK